MERTRGVGEFGSVVPLRRRAAAAVAWLVLGVACAAPALADPPVPSATEAAPSPADQQPPGLSKGHGSISIAYLDTYVNGFHLDSNTVVPNGQVRSHGIALGLDYYFADAWSAHIGIPFVSNRYRGSNPHCPTSAPPQCAGIPALNPQHPESQFLDDGNYHGTWADWDLGVAYHKDLNGYLITPSITASIPSHDYTFFANAAVAQDIWQVEVATSVAHQFEFSNWYYRIGYGYVFTQSTLGTDVNHHKLNLELGYFVNPKLQVRAFTIGRVGHGYASAHILPLTQGTTNDLWFHHDQIAEHNYFGAGAGFDYQLGDKYSMSASLQREFWGETVFNFKYALDLRLTREF